LLGKYMTQINIKDESGDKRYFTIIPNYILNHSTANDQALYMQMKRIAGDNGTCDAGVRYFTKQLGLGTSSVKNSIKYLIDHHWIEYLGKTEVKTRSGIQKVNTYKVNDIWKENNNHYDDIGVSKQTHLTKQGVSENALRCIQNDNEVYLGRDRSKNIKKELKERTVFSFKKKPKPYYEGFEMRRSAGKWYVLRDGDWLDYADTEEKIEWK
jgi:hypothetical protein